MKKAVIVDALARGQGRRRVTLDVIGVGPRAVAGILMDRGFSVDIYPAETIIEEPLILGDYDVLLVSAMTSDKGAAHRVSMLWRRYSNGPSILGGPITTEPGTVTALKYDYGVYGEAEIPLPRLLHSIFSGDPSVQDIPGIIVYGRKTFKKPGYTPRKLLNYYHPPLIDNYPLYWASRVYVEIVRGCSNFRRPSIPLPDGRKCIRCPICYRSSTPLEARLACPVGIPAGCGYCSVPALYGPARSRSVDLIVKEIKSLIDKGVTRVVLSAPDVLDYGRDYLVDPKPLTDPCSPGANLNALKNLFEKIWEIPEIYSGDAFILLENMKACLVDERVAGILSKYFQGTPVHIGVESGDDTHLRLIGRPSYTRDVERAVKLLSEKGMEPYVYFIYALPGENREVALKTTAFMEKLARLGARKITVYRFRPLPGTAFEKYYTTVTANSLLIKRKAVELNKKLKRELVGKTVKAVIAGHRRDRGLLVAYPLPHGPVVLLQGSRKLIGWIVEVKILDVISDRETLGVITRILRRVAGKEYSKRLASH